MTERHEEHKETLSNGCSIKVTAEILKDGSLKMLIGVYRPDGSLLFTRPGEGSIRPDGSVIEEDHHPSPHLLDMEAAMDWAIEKAKTVGNSQQTL